MEYINIHEELGLDQMGVIDEITPTHGPCCTCQKCGFSHDDCKCEANHNIRLAGKINKMQEEHKQMLNKLKEVMTYLVTADAPMEFLFEISDLIEKTERK